MTIGAGGEEWRIMQTGSKGYDPSADSDVLAEARKNIDRIRKRDVALRVVDSGGKPLAGRQVEIKLNRHAFCFGDQLWALDRMFRFNQAETDRARYWKLRFADVLNSANALCYWTERPRNDGPKTEDIQGRPQLDGFRYCVNWAASEGLTVKGHPLVWSIPKCVPDWVMRYDYETQMKFLEVRVRQLISAAAGKVRIWDLVNEALWEPAWKNLPNRNWPHIEDIENIADYIAPAVGWARDEDPDACYIINDYGLMSDKTRDEQELKSSDGTVVTSQLQRKRFRRLIKVLGDRGCPPDAMGLQSHTGGWVSPREQQAVYDELAEAGLPLHITEFSAPTRELSGDGELTDEQTQQLLSQYVSNYMTVAFGHPAIEAFFFWGFINQAVRFRGENSGHETTVVYDTVRRLIRDEWTTRECLTTDENGCVSFRGFFGDYSLRWQVSEDQTCGTRFRVAAEQQMPLTLQARPLT
ncbi:MAG: endo-1,4-beta-xylanase [Phycisphaerae bacterium]